MSKLRSSLKGAYPFGRMTIAACYLSMEGVVFGTDSTTTIPVPGPTGAFDSHYFDYGQKIYEIGRESQVGVAIWGLGSFGQVASYRTLIAEVGDELQQMPSVEEVAVSLGKKVWSAFEQAYGPTIHGVRDLAGKPDRSDDEEKEFQRLASISGGFCVGGCRGGRTPGAFEVAFDILNGVAAPKALPVGLPQFWGAPNVMNRMIYGIDFGLLNAIVEHDKWSGTTEEMVALVSGRKFHQPSDLPLREAVDWVYASVFSTIKAFKFSHLDPICGGPVEIAVISTDRTFRWVRHKSFDAAI